MKNEDRENIKVLFNDILNIITDDYNIIFDNEEPSSTVKKKINYLHFSGDSSVGRKGLIP